MLENSEVFFIGCVGAIAPEILRLYRLRNSIRFTWSWGYILISIIFVLLGGFVSYILEPSNNYAAFHSGVGTPFIINAIIKEPLDRTTSPGTPVVKSTNSDEEIIRVGKGITEKEVRQKELDKLQQININHKNMTLKDFFRAL